MAKLRKNLTSFIESALRVHGQKYDYSKSVYNGGTEKLIIICREHGEFLQTPSDHINSNAGCKVCGYNKLSKLYRKPADQVIIEANKLHDNYYTYDLLNYKNETSKIKITCPKHGEFKQTVKDHLMGCGCSKCNISHSSIEQQWLKSINLPEHHYGGTIYIDGKRYNFDAYDPDSNTIYEFYGDYWHSNPVKFDLDKEHPHLKITHRENYQKTCNRHDYLLSLNYKLVTVWESTYRQQIKEKN